VLARLAKVQPASYSAVPIMVIFFITVFGEAFWAVSFVPYPNKPREDLCVHRIVGISK
jgi:hypothetical protein